jgi:hypothetical protein
MLHRQEKGRPGMGTARDLVFSECRLELEDKSKLNAVV